MQTELPTVMLTRTAQVRKSPRTVTDQYTAILLLIHGSSAFKSRVGNRRAYLKIFFYFSFRFSYPQLVQEILRLFFQIKPRRIPLYSSSLLPADHLMPLPSY